MAPYLTCAIPLAQQNPPELMAGDGVDLLPAVTEAVPDSSVLCIVRIFTQLPQNSREPLSSLVLEYGAKRDMFSISSRPHRGYDSGLHVLSFENGHGSESLSAYLQNHEEWIEWLETNAD